MMAISVYRQLVPGDYDWNLWGTDHHQWISEKNGQGTECHTKYNLAPDSHKIAYYNSPETIEKRFYQIEVKVSKHNNFFHRKLETSGIQLLELSSLSI